jgi:hypothetical protein
MIEQNRPLVFAKAAAARGLRADARRLHRAILRHFAETGERPSAAALAGQAAVLDELQAVDLVLVDRGGEIRAAYPFSPTRTAHHVQIADGPAVYAMCAIDALGISAMLNRPVSITSHDITIDVDGAYAIWHPDTAVVYAGTTDQDATSADTTCSYINFFVTEEAASAWAEGHPDIAGRLLTQAEAIAAGIAEFGGFLV